MPEPTASPLADLPPLREGLLQLQPPRLLGSECTSCGTRLFPAREFCPACDGAEVRQVPLSPRGHVYSWTIVRQAPGQRPTPYTLAYIDLEDGVRLLAQLDHAEAEPALGAPVQLAIGPVPADDGTLRLGYRFTTAVGGQQ